MNREPIPRFIFATLGAAVLAFGIAQTSFADNGACYTEIHQTAPPLVPPALIPDYGYAAVICQGTCPPVSGTNQFCTTRSKATVTVPADSPSHPNESAIGQTCSCYYVPTGEGQPYWALETESACFAWIYVNPLNPSEAWYADCATVGCNPTNCLEDQISAHQEQDGSWHRSVRCICK